MFSARTNVNKAVVLRCDFPQWFCLFCCLVKTNIYQISRSSVRLNVFKSIAVISGGVSGVGTQGVSAVGVGHAAEGYDASRFWQFCMFITSAHLGRFGLLRSSDSFRPI